MTYLEKPCHGLTTHQPVDRYLSHKELAPNWTNNSNEGAELYVVGGIRAVEIGTAMFGKRNAETGNEKPGPRELVRLAIPRQVYSQSHVD